MLGGLAGATVGGGAVVGGVVVGGVVVGGEVVTGVLLVCPDDRAASGRDVAHADSTVHATTTAATPGATFQHLEVRPRAEVPPPVAGTIDTSPMSSEDPAARHVAPRNGAPGKIRTSDARFRDQPGVVHCVR